MSLLNVLIIAFLPMTFTGEEVKSEYEFTQKYKSIADAVAKGEVVSLEDREYLKEQAWSSTLEARKSAKENLLGANKSRITLGSILQTSAISLISLIILSVLKLFESTASLVYFSLGSLLIMLISPVGSGQLFLIIITNMMIVFSVVHLIKYIKSSR